MGRPWLQIAARRLGSRFRRRECCVALRAKRMSRSLFSGSSRQFAGFVKSIASRTFFTSGAIASPARRAIESASMSELVRSPAPSTPAMVRARRRLSLKSAFMLVTVGPQGKRARGRCRTPKPSFRRAKKRISLGETNASKSKGNPRKCEKRLRIPCVSMCDNPQVSPFRRGLGPRDALFRFGSRSPFGRSRIRQLHHARAKTPPASRPSLFDPMQSAPSSPKARCPARMRVIFESVRI